jgi:hypothetical protein
MISSSLEEACGSPRDGVLFPCGAAVTPRFWKGRSVETLLFIGAVVLFVVALLGLDWFMAGRPGGRRMKAARDGEAGNANPGNALIQQQSVHDQWNRAP